MRNITTKHGCYDAVKCGDTCKTCGALRRSHPPMAPNDHEYVPQGAHVCGSPDPCVGVKPNGEVCTFGTMQSVPVFSQTDVDEVHGRMKKAHQREHGQPANSGEERILRTLARHLVGAVDGNDDTPEVEAAHRAAHEKNHADNQAFHDANPSVFGH